MLFRKSDDLQRWIIHWMSWFLSWQTSIHHPPERPFPSESVFWWGPRSLCVRVKRDGTMRGTWKQIKKTRRLITFVGAPISQRGTYVLYQQASSAAAFVGRGVASVNSCCQKSVIRRRFFLPLLSVKWGHRSPDTLILPPPLSCTSFPPAHYFTLLEHPSLKTNSHSRWHAGNTSITHTAHVRTAQSGVVIARRVRLFFFPQRLFFSFYANHFHPLSQQATYPQILSNNEPRPAALHSGSVASKWETLLCTVPSTNSVCHKNKIKGPLMRVVNAERGHNFLRSHIYINSER